MSIPFYAAFLESCAVAADQPTLLRLHARLIISGISSHRLLRTKLCAGYSRCLRTREAHRLFALAARRPAFLYNSLIRSHAELSQFHASLSVYASMLTDGVAPTHHSVASALRSAASLASLRLGRAVHSTALSSAIIFENPVVPNSLISMYSACGELSSARRVLDEMPHRNKNLVTWTAMIDAYGCHGRTKESLDMFERMVEEGWMPDAKAMTSVLAACARGGAVEAGLKLFDVMLAGGFGGVRPKMEHYTCMVDMLGRAGRLEAAETLVMEMAFEPDHAMWAVILKACQMNRRLDVAERIAQRFYKCK